MRDRKLATRYARALLATLKAGDAENVDAFLTALAHAIATSRDFRDVLLNPAVPRAARIKVLVTLAKQHGMPAEVGSFMRVVVNHGRAGSLTEIATAFNEAREEAAGIVPVELQTAAPLPQDLQNRARSILEKLTGKTVRLQFHVDPTRLGGAVARIGSKVYDGSLRTQLDILRRRMAAE
jgi:F-type H+-transporting ATPase subunit delta